jgi:type IV secretory pathway VirB2 component (pilin)
MLNRIKNAAARFFGSTTGRIVTGATAFAVVAATAGPAGATGDVISDAFTTLQGTLLGYLGDAVVVIIALLGLGSGIRFLVKWIRKAVSSS